MQPNQQQNNNSNQYGSPLGANIPEYLHLDPVVEPKAKRPRGHFIILLVALLMLGGGVVATLLLTSASPQDRFYTAVNNSTNALYVTRNISVSTDSLNIKLTASADTDFSDPYAQMSKITYAYTRPSQSATTKEKVFHLEGDIVTVSNTKFFGKITKAPSDGLDKSTTLNKWYAFTSSGSSTFDISRLSQYFNAPINVIPLGGIDPSVREIAFDSIKSSNVYQIVNSRSNDTVTDYFVNVDTGKLNKLMARLASIQGFFYKDTPMTNKISNPVHIKVDNTHERIAQISYKFESPDTTKNSIVVNFTYPGSVTINVPSPGNG